MFVALIQAPTFSRRHTKTHADNNNATQKKTAIDQQQHSCETLICQRHQTILRLLSSAATASPRWRVRELNTFNAELNPICHLLALLGAHHILHVSRVRVTCPTTYNYETQIAHFVCFSIILYYITTAP